MSDRYINPFLRFAKSNDLTDANIRRLWVDFDARHGQAGLFDPASPMATVVLGGKGSGKSHLFRYHSFPVQGMRYSEQGLLDAFREEQYLGVYIRASGLNGARFGGKGVEEEQWLDVFAYYIELWFAQTFLGVVDQISQSSVEMKQREATIVSQSRDLFTDDVPASIDDFPALGRYLLHLQHDLDRMVDGAAFSREISPAVRVPRGRLLFGLPRLVCENVEELADIIVSYFVDEYENFQEYQQRYINTLLREREGPVTFRIGARAYGMRTYSTFSGERASGRREEIQEGSEFQYLKLDASFRREPKQYRRFARRLLALRVAGVANSPLEVDGPDAWFAEDLGLVQEGGETRPHMERARRHFKEIVSEDEATEIINRVSDADPVVEKAAIFNLYQSCAKGEFDLLARASSIEEGIGALRRGRKHGLAETIAHYGDDFKAQLRRSRRLGASSYSGIENFLTMSEGLPRVLLTIVGNIYGWAAFKGELEKIDDANGISLEAQKKGLMDTAEWFLADLPDAGESAEAIRTSIRRLGELFRINRFADKPVECSLVSFSVKLEALSVKAKNTILEAERRSFLVENIAGQKDRSSKDVRQKYHMNRMLSPIFDLPLAYRGTTRLDVDAAEAIFGSETADQFNELRNMWSSRMNWPFKGSRLGASRRLL